MDKQLELDKKYLKMAYIWADNSYAIRRHVGCLVVKDKMIISDGYNGMPSGFPNVCEDYINPNTLHTEISSNKEELNTAMELFEDLKLVTKPEVLHAEANAITKLARSNNSSEGATIYITCEPCIECSKLIIQSGIVRVVYSESYTKHDGINLLKRAGIKVEQIEL